MVSSAALLQKGVEHHRAGELDRAEQLYRQALRHDPAHPDAFHLLGVAAHQRGDNRRAVECISRAVRLDGSAALYHCNLGAAYRAMGESEMAADCFRRALDVDPDFAGAHYNLAMVLESQGRPDEAITSYRQAIRCDVSLTAAYNNLGRLLASREQREEAIGIFRRAVEIDPDFVAAHYNLANAYHDDGRLEVAVAAFREAVRIDPSVPELHNNLGTALKDLNRLDAAARSFERAIELNHGYAEAYNNLGTIHQLREELDRAVECYRKAVELKPDFTVAHTNHATVLDEQGRMQQAIRGYERAIRIDPDYAEARFNRSLALLRSGQFQCGWQEYEWRWAKKFKPRNFPYPTWDGTPLAGRVILVYAEQGIGDEIMFASCLPEVVAQAGDVIVECDSRLMPLFARSFPTAHLVARPYDASKAQTGASLPKIELQIASGSLPRYLRQSTDVFPDRRSYLKPDAAACEAWRSRLAALGDGLKVGISWRGGREPTVRKKRSTRLLQWSRVLAVPGVHIVSLQYGDVAADLAETRRELGVRIHDWPEVDPLSNLDEFAALVAALDLLISVDNSTVHMAGALGVPVWTLLPSAADFRWLFGREDSPWYPSMRLIRQRQRHDWHEVLDRVAEDLSSAVESGGVREPDNVRCQPN